ncbi:hypothetical protein ID47_04860 [Candidatus Paracaedibacter acanthamoebae]|uniref:Uncharacterized protein n=1 Tax=Candidatus Odyssella acanthamoebae TaxID=91604 RepID=A0A077AX70_9PROT|nr:hypothetical protein ID47_04860 [Candidatus Paracaedibacter acanthamoebae]
MAKAKGLLSKTDKIDSMVLAEYGLRLQPKLFSDASQKTYELRRCCVNGKQEQTSPFPKIIRF